MCPTSVGTSRARVLESGEAKLWVLLVGVNRYEDEQIANLSYSALDCQGLGEAIAAATQGFPQRSMVLHHDWGGEASQGQGRESEKMRSIVQEVAIARRMGLGVVAKVRSFPAQSPRLTGVLASLERIVTAAKPQDTVLFYFSGHGLMTADSQQAVLCLADTQKDDLVQTGLAIEVLLDRLGHCAARQQMVWLDACHSGGMTLRGAKHLPEPEGNPMPRLVEVLQRRAAQSQGFYALLSCDRAQQSWEFPELGHGVFTYYLMRGLLGEAADAQGVVEADALYKYVYYQTLRYIDQTNQQLRLINQQKRGRGDDQLQPEYPLQTPKRIVEGVGELILGMRSQSVTVRYPRRALVVDGLGMNAMTLELSKQLRGEGGFELTVFPQSGQPWAMLQESIQDCLRSNEKMQVGTQLETDTVLLYLRGRIQISESGEARLVLPEGVEMSRDWLRQTLRRSKVTHQIVILDCPGASHLAEWMEDLQIDAEKGQCLMAVASPAQDTEWFARVLWETLQAVNPQVGLSIAGWIAQIQAQLAGTGMTLETYLSGSQGVMEILPGQVRGVEHQAETGLDLGICPYMGLKAFTEADAPFFFGREPLTQQLVSQISQQSFLAVVGASGSGKSSVVQAGLISQLRQGKQIPNSDRWWIQQLCPGTDPIDTLLQVMVNDVEIETRPATKQQLEGMVYQGVEGFVYWLRSRPEPVVVLVIDQFEELFTLAAAAERQRFLALILGGLAYASDRFKLVLTLRSDFIAPCLEYPALAEALQAASVLVPPVLLEENYRQIILRPAEKVGLAVEPALVEVLLQELSHEAGDLPLLEFVLEQLWEQRQPGKLTLEVYQKKLGGLKRSLEQKAQEVYDRLNAEEQACARWIFLSLTQLGDGTEDTRRRIRKSELIVKKYPAELVDRSLKALTDAKLILINSDGLSDRFSTKLSTELSTEPSAELSTELSAAPNDTSLTPNASTLPTLPPSHPPISIEVIHEILIRHWSTLRWWLEENRTRLRTLRQIEQSAAQWITSGQTADFLLRGVRLDAAEELYIKYTDELSEEVQLFIEAGLAEREQEQNATKRRLRQARRSIALISALGLAATGFGGFAWVQRQRSTLNEIMALNALSESQLVASQEIEAIETSLQASELLQAMSGLGVDNETQNTIRMQTIATLQQSVELTQERNRFAGHQQAVNQVAASADGQMIASASDDATVRLWRPDGSLIRTLQFPDRVTSLVWSLDNQQLWGGDGSGTVTVMAVTTGAVVRSLQVGKFVTAVALSPTGEILATASRDPMQADGDRTIKLWRVADGRLLRTLNGHQGWVNGLSFSPDGKTLASASEDRTVRVWTIDNLTTQNLMTQNLMTQNLMTQNLMTQNLMTQNLMTQNLMTQNSVVRVLTGHSDRVTSVAFSPDGQWLVSGSGDRTLRLWNLTDNSGQIREGHTAQVNSVRFSPDSQYILSASEDQTLKLWHRSNDAVVRTLKGHGAAVLSAVFDAQGRSLLSASRDKSVRLWNLPDLRIPGESYYAIAFSPDRSVIAAVQDQTIKILSGERDRWGQPLKVLNDRAMATAIALSPKQQLAAVREDGIELWDLQTGKVGATLVGQAALINQIAWSPTQPLLAVASEDQTIQLWRTTDGRLLRTLKGHENGVSTVAFSPNGGWLASGSHDNMIKLWQSDGTLLRTLTGHSLSIASLAFSPAGNILASGSADNTVKLWRTSDGTALHTLRGHEDNVTAIAFTADGRILASAGRDRQIKLWNAHTGELIKTLQGGSDRILTLGFSPDQDALLMGSEDQGVQRLDLRWRQLEQRGCDRLEDYQKNGSKTPCF